jgi:tripartite-type tricarboxylate transporter receptor subunit TctC
MSALRLFLAAALLFGVQAGALAQAWPTKTVRIVTTLAPGSATDIIARTLAERLSAQINQPVIVENRTGASTTIGAGVVAKSEPDGYTLLVTSSAHTVAPFLYSNMTYDTARDLAAVAPLANVPTLLVAPASKGYRTVQDLVAAARAKPGSINYASAAASTQLNAERFRRSAKFEAVHIGFKGAAEALNEVMAGRVDFYFSPIAAALPLVRDGKLVALAVGSSKRASILPDLPTTIEAGFPDSDYNFWIALFVPAKTPRALVNRLHHETTTAMNVPEVRERVARLGTEPMSMTPEQFDDYIRDELKTNESLVKAAGMKAN